MTWPVLIALLFAVIAEKESHFDPAAWNRDEDSVGIVQIRRCVIDDINEAYGLDFSYADRWSPYRSRLIFALCMALNAERYRKETGKEPDVEALVRMWNGGPDGYREPETLEYWRAVKPIFERVRKQWQKGRGVCSR